MSSDFDNTLTQANSGLALCMHYLLRGKASLPRRLRSVMGLRGDYLKHSYLGQYYAVLRSIPASERKAVLARLEPNARWLDAVHWLRLGHRAQRVEVTIVSRNCPEVIQDWVEAHKALLALHRVVIVAIIANRPLHTAEAGAADASGAGDAPGGVDSTSHRMHSVESKGPYLPPRTIYLGDAEEEPLRSSVEEFVRV